jgi:hypothetical protein
LVLQLLFGVPRVLERRPEKDPEGVSLGGSEGVRKGGAMFIELHRACSAHVYTAVPAAGSCELGSPVLINSESVVTASPTDVKQCRLMFSGHIHALVVLETYEEVRSLLADACGFRGITR